MAPILRPVGLTLPVTKTTVKCRHVKRKKGRFVDVYTCIRRFGGCAWVSVWIRYVTHFCNSAINSVAAYYYSVNIVHQLWVRQKWAMLSFCELIGWYTARACFTFPLVIVNDIGRWSVTHSPGENMCDTNEQIKTSTEGENGRHRWPVQC